MSIGDTIFIFFLALIFFGPKKLPELARQVGKLVAEFRRASNDFRFQMEEELRMAEQSEAQKKVAALRTAQQGDAAPTAIAEGAEISILPPATGLPVGASTEGASDGSASGAALDADSILADPESAEEVRAEQGSAEERAMEERATEQPVQHQPSLLSGLLGPPSQADALSVPEPVSGTVSLPGPGPSAHPHDRLHSPSNHDAAAAAEPVEAAHEVQAAHG